MGTWIRKYTKKRQRGSEKELDYFAKPGYVVFQSDYRGYGTSDLDPSNDVRPRNGGYVEDVLNAISALKNRSRFSRPENTQACSDVRWAAE